MEKTKKIGIMTELTKRVQIANKIVSSYKSLSKFSHVTFETLDSLADWEEGTGLRDVGAIYFAYSYGELPFTECSDELWEVIDLVIAVVVLEKSRFYGYSSPVDLLKLYFAKDDRAKEFFDFIENKLEAKLPITSTLIKVLQNS